MIDINNAKKVFEKFLSKYEDNDKLGFELKIIHTNHVMATAKDIAIKLNLAEEDIRLAELIGLLHDIGRFEEITILNQFDGVKFDHAEYGVKMLFEDGLIRKFIENNDYDEIIKEAIYNHNKLEITKGLSDRALLHAKIIRDADKLDNFRVKKDEIIEAIFPGVINSKDEFENSLVSEKIYETIKKEKCINIADRKTPLDYWICVLAFIYDLNFKQSYEIVKDKDYINILIDRFNYNNYETKLIMENIRIILNSYVDKKLI